MTTDRALNAVVWFPWVILVLGLPVILWWLFEPNPLTIRYVAPYFVDRPVETRDEAEMHPVFAVAGGQQLYRYIEYCVSRPFTATAKRSWVNSAMVWHAPDVPTQLSRTAGCRSANVVVEVPTSNPSRTFMFVQKMEVDVNPIRRDEVIEYPPIPLTILSR